MSQGCHCPYLASSQKKGQRHRFPWGATSDAGAQQPSEPSRGGYQSPQILRNWASRGALLSHLPLALGQPLHLALLGLQHLLHLGAEGQAPGVALGSREVSAPPVWPSPRFSRPGLALSACHLHPGLGCPVQDVSTRRGVSGQLPWPRQQGDRGPESGRSGPGGPPRAGSSEHSPPSLSEQTISPMLGGMRRSARSGLPLPHAGQTWAHCAGSRGIQGWGRGRLGLGGSPRPAAAASPAVSAAPSPHRAAGPCGGGQCPSWKWWDGSGSTLLPCCWPGPSGPVFRAYPTARLTLSAVTDPCHPGNCHPSNSS